MVAITLAVEGAYYSYKSNKDISPKEISEIIVQNSRFGEFAENVKTVQGKTEKSLDNMTREQVDEMKVEFEVPVWWFYRRQSFGMDKNLEGQGEGRIGVDFVPSGRIKIEELRSML